MDAGLGAIKKNRFNQHMGEIDLSNEVPISGPSTQKTSFSPQQQQQQQQQQQYSNNNMGYGMVPPGQRQYTNNTGYPMMSQPQQQQINPRINYNGYSNGNPRMAMPVQPEIRSNTMPTRFESSPMSMSRNNNPSHNNNNNSNNHSFNFSKGKHTLTNIFKKKNNSPMGAGGFDIADDDDDDDFGTGSSKNNNNSVNNNSFNGGVGDMNNNDEEVTVDSNEILTFSDITGLRNTGGPNYGGSQRDDTAPIIPTLVTKINQKPSKLSNTEYRKMMFNQKKMAMSTLSKQHSNQTAPPPPRTMSLQGNWNAMPQQQPGGRPMPNTRFAGPPNGQPAYPRSNSMMNSGMPPPRFRQQPQLMQQGFPQHQQPMYQEQSPRAMSLTNTPRFMNSGMNPQPHLSQQQQQQPQDPYFNNNVDRSNNLPQDNFSLPNNGRAMSMQNKSVNPMFNGQGMTTYNNNNNNNSNNNNNTHNQNANITNVHRNGDNNMNNKTLNLRGRTNIPSSFSSSDLLNNAKSQHLQYRKPFVQSQSLNNIKENASNNNNNIRDNKNVNNYKNLPSTRSNLSHEFNINDIDNNKQQDNTTGNENGAIPNANVTNTRSASDVSIEIIDNPSIKQPDITNIKKNNKNGSVDSFDFTDKTPEDQQIIDTTLPKNNTAQPFKPAAAIVNNSGNTHSIDEYNNSENSYHISLRPNTHRKTLSADLRPGSALFSGLSPNSSNSFANTNGMLNGQHSKTNSTVSSIGEPTPNYQQKKMYALANNTTDMNLYVTADEFPTDSKGFTSSSSVSPPQRDNRLDSLTAQFQNKNNMGNVDANQTYSTLLGTVQDTSDATIENDLEDNSTTNSKNASRSSDIFDPNFSNEQFVKVEANSNIDKRKSLIEVKDNKTYSTKTDIVSSNTTPVLMANNVFDSDQTPQVDKTHRPKSNDVVLLDQLPSDPGKNDEVEGLRVEEITISQTIEQNRRSSFTNVNNNSHSKLNATSGSTRIISINSQTSSSKSSNYSTAENQEEKQQQQQQQQQESSLNALKADTCTKKTTVEPGDVSNGSVKSASSNMKSIKSKLNEKPLNKAKKFFRKFSAQKKDTSENQKSSDNDASTITTATNTLTDTADMSFVQDDPLFANKEILKPEPLPPIPQQEPLPLMFSQEDDFVENNSPTNKPIPPQFSSQISKDISNSGENNGNVEIKIEMPSTSGLERSHKPLPLVTNKDSHDNKENITNSFSSNTDQSEFKSKEIITKVWDESDKDANPRKSYHSLFSGPSPGPNKIKFFNQSGTPSPLQSSFNNDPERTVLYDVSDISDAASSTNNNKDSDSGNTNNVNIAQTSNVTKTHPQQRAPTTPQSLDEGKNANSQALETINESDAPNTIVTSGTKDNVDNDTVSKVITNNSVYLASPSTVNTEDFALMNNPRQVLYQPSFVSNPDKELYVTKKVYSAGNESDQQHTQHSEDARFKTFVISPEQLSVLGENRKLMNELTMVSTELAESIARETALEKILNEKEYQNNDTHGEVFSNRDTNSIEDDNRGLNDMINIQSELRKKSSKIVTLIQELNAERLKRFIAEEQVLLYEKGCKPSNLELSYDINSLQKQLQEKNHEIECLRAQIGHS